MLNGLKHRIVELRKAPGRVAMASAPRIEDKFRKDATTRRGNVPSYGAFGQVPIVAKGEARAIVVRAPDWCLQKAEELKQIDGWTEIVSEDAARILGGGR